MNTSDAFLSFGAAFLYLLIPGVLLWIVFRDSSRRWHSSVFAWIIVLYSRWRQGHWNSQLGKSGDQPAWPVEVASALVSWALTFIFVWLSYRLTRGVARHIKREPQT